MLEHGVLAIRLREDEELQLVGEGGHRGRGEGLGQLVRGQVPHDRPQLLIVLDGWRQDAEVLDGEDAWKDRPQRHRADDGVVVQLAQEQASVASKASWKRTVKRGIIVVLIVCSIFES